MIPVNPRPEWQPANPSHDQIVQIVLQELGHQRQDFLDRNLSQRVGYVAAAVGLSVAAAVLLETDIYARNITIATGIAVGQTIVFKPKNVKEWMGATVGAIIGIGLAAGLTRAYTENSPKPSFPYLPAIGASPFGPLCASAIFAVLRGRC
jgi:hypothetical protein